MLPADAPSGKYDLLFTRTDKEVLREEIKRQLGLVAHRETRLTDVLALEVNPATGARLRTSEGGKGAVSFSGWRASGVRRLVLTNQPVALLNQLLESHLGLPVFDRTGWTANCDVKLEWNAQTNVTAEEVIIRLALASQLGLRLVLGQESVEMLVVEKLRDSK